MKKSTIIIISIVSVIALSISSYFIYDNFFKEKEVQKKEEQKEVIRNGKIITVYITKKEDGDLLYNFKSDNIPVDETRILEKYEFKCFTNNCIAKTVKEEFATFFENEKNYVIDYKNNVIVYEGTDNVSAELLYNFEGDKTVGFQLYNDANEFAFYSYKSKKITISFGKYDGCTTPTRHASTCYIDDDHFIVGNINNNEETRKYGLVNINTGKELIALANDYLHCYMGYCRVVNNKSETLYDLKNEKLILNNKSYNGVFTFYDKQSDLVINDKFVVLEKTKEVKLVDVNGNLIVNLGTLESLDYSMGIGYLPNGDIEFDETTNEVLKLSITFVIDNDSGEVIIYTYDLKTNKVTSEEDFLLLP